eukprot:1221445-Ditylum_brightwellii.AAC.1
MRAAKERPPAKPPWATPASIAHPFHSYPFNQTPTTTNNQENQTKRLASTTSPPNLQSSIQLPASTFLQYNSTYTHPSKLQQQTHAHTSH